MTSHSGLPHLLRRIARPGTSQPRPRSGKFFAALIVAVLSGAMVAGQEDVTVEEEPAKKPDDHKTFLLASPKFFESWEHYSAEQGTQRVDVWRIIPEKAVTENNGETIENVLICTGKPFGYLRSKEVYENCQIGLQWRFPKDDNGNSGVLVYVDGKDEIWPKSIQVQLHRPKVGGVFPMKDATCDPHLPGKMLEKPATEWNSCIITCRDGTIALEINGQDFGVVKGCMPAKGFIALQSEGAEVHFRQIWRRPLK